MKEFDQFKSFANKGKLPKVLTSNAVVYTRVSSKEQDENTSLDYQRKRCGEYADRKGYRVVEYFGGTYESAKSDERKEFQKMLSYVKKSKEKISRIIVLSFDRFSRSGANSIYLIASLKEMGIFVESVQQEMDTTTPSGELMQNIQLLFSKMDNDQRRMKCVAGMQEMLRAGHLPNRAPIGYRHNTGTDWDNRIVPDEKTGLLIAKAFRMKAQQGLSNTEIAEKLAALGLKLNRKVLTKIFKNPYYAGIIIHSLLPGEVIKGKHQPLVSEEVFLAVNNITVRSKHGAKAPKEEPEFPLKQYVRCDECGTSMTAYHVRGKNASYYKCNKIGCKVNKSSVVMHTKFEELLASYSVDEKFAKPMEVMMKRVFDHLNQQQIEDSGLIHRKITQIEGNIAKLTDLYVEGKITQQNYETTLSRYQQDRDQAARKLSETKEPVSNLDEYIRFTVKMSSSLNEIWRTSDHGVKQNIQNVIFPEGIRYNKQMDNYRTLRVNSFFAVIGSLSSEMQKNKSGISE